MVDTTGTLDAATVQRLDVQARALQQRKGSQLQVLVVPSTRPESIEQYAVSADGRRFLILEPLDDNVRNSVGVFLNWPALLHNRQAP